MHVHVIVFDKISLLYDVHGALKNHDKGFYVLGSLHDLHWSVNAG